MAQLLDRDLLYLSNKRALLANPGTKMDDIYYSALNTTVELSEATYNSGRLSISLGQLQFGSQSQVVIPNSSLLQAVYLHLELPDIAATNQTICRGWGYAAIDSISYLFGSSNVSQVSVNGQSHFQTIMMQCETAEKRSEMFRLGGHEYIASSGGTITADVQLALPFSTAAGLYSKLPFDTNLLSNPITINIKFKSASAIYGGSNTAIPSAFLHATIYVRQGDLTNKDQSLKFELMRQPDLMYAYPFIHHQPYTPSKFTGKITSGDPVSLPLLSFINADLLSISIGVVRDSRYAPTSNSSPSQLAYDDISNIQLLFNGLVMYDAPGKLWKLLNINSEIGASYFHNSVIRPGATSPFNSDPVDSYILVIDFSRIRCLTYEGRYQNVWRIGNNTLTLNFNTETTELYTLFATYHYNGVAEVQNGETRIFFD